jgi:broad specificity phosphatase PhoE
MTRLYMIRHGRPAAAWGGGDDDPGLDPEGVRQAQEAAQALMSLPADERPISVVSSPLRRCTETARPLAMALGTEMEIVTEVGEIPTPAALAPGERGAWLRTSLLGRWPDIRGDLDYDLWRRSVFNAIRQRPGAAIFSHFVAINAVLSVLEGRDQVITFRPDHTSITVLDARDGDVRLVARGREAATSVL